MPEPILRPGQGRAAARPMHFIWIVDCSGSMDMDGKIQALNTAVKESLPEMKNAAEANPHAEMLVRTVAFSSGARWHDAQPTRVHDFQWRDLPAGGVTDMGEAFQLVADELNVERLGDRGYPPVLVLISDGQPTDDYRSGLNALMSTQWGKRAARVAVAIGKDCDHGPLQEFIGNIEFPVLQANNPQSLVNYIKWVSQEVSKAASSPASQTREQSEAESYVNIPSPPPPVSDDGDPDVW